MPADFPIGARSAWLRIVCRSLAVLRHRLPLGGRPLVPAALRSALGTSSPTIFLWGPDIPILVIFVLFPAAGRELLRQLRNPYLLSHFRPRAPGCPIGTHPRALRDHMRGCEWPSALRLPFADGTPCPPELYRPGCCAALALRAACPR